MSKEKKQQKLQNQAKKQDSQSQSGFGVIDYPAGDFLIRLKNAALARHKSLIVPNTSFIRSLAKVLIKESYLTDIQEKGKGLIVNLAYRKKHPVLTDVKLISKPGLRVYLGVKKLKGVRGPSLMVVSTPQGVMTKKEALKKGLGGEVIAEVL